MERSLILAGFGGQGILLLGKVIAACALEEGKEVSWLPSYGPEMRGGTANCTVVVSDRPIGSPVVRRPDVAVVMNIPSCEKFAPLVRPGGLLFVNSTLVPDASIPARNDVELLKVAATGIAIELGAPIVANMVALGAVVERTGLVSPKTVDAEVQHLFGRSPKALELDRRAIVRGAETVRVTRAREVAHA